MQSENACSVLDLRMGRRRLHRPRDSGAQGGWVRGRQEVSDMQEENEDDLEDEVDEEGGAV